MRIFLKVSHLDEIRKRIGINPEKDAKTAFCWDFDEFGRSHGPIGYYEGPPEKYFSLDPPRRQL